MLENVPHVDGCLINAQKIEEIEQEIKKLGNNDKITEILEKVNHLYDKVDSEYNLLFGLMQSIQIEFADHRRGLVLMLEAHGIPCDDILGFPQNNEVINNDFGKSEVDERKNRRGKKKKRRGNKENV